MVEATFDTDPGSDNFTISFLSFQWLISCRKAGKTAPVVDQQKTWILSLQKRFLFSQPSPIATVLLQRSFINVPCLYGAVMGFETFVLSVFLCGAVQFASQKIKTSEMQAKNWTYSTETQDMPL